jgi:hypothetical protein
MFVSEIRFSSAPTKFLELLMRDLTAFTLSIENEWIEVFSVMANLGFFRVTGERYPMTVPSRISGSGIEAALLKLAATEDDGFSLYPECLVHCVSYAQTISV